MFKEKAETRKNISNILPLMTYINNSREKVHTFIFTKKTKFLIQVYLVLNNVFEIKILLK